MIHFDIVTVKWPGVETAKESHRSTYSHLCDPPVVLFKSSKARPGTPTEKCYRSRRTWIGFVHAYNPSAGESDCWTPETCWTDSPAKSVSSRPGKLESLSQRTRWTPLEQLTVLKVDLWTPHICSHMCKHTWAHKLTHTWKWKVSSLLNPMLELKRQSSLGNSGHSISTYNPPAAEKKFYFMIIQHMHLPRYLFFVHKCDTVLACWVRRPKGKKWGSADGEAGQCHLPCSLFKLVDTLHFMWTN